MIAGVPALAGFPVGALTGSDICLVTDDGVDAIRLAFAVKLDGAIQVAVIGEGQGIHALLFGVLHEFGNAVRAVEQAVVAMAMEMNEVAGHGESLTPQARRLACGLGEVLPSPQASLRACGERTKLINYSKSVSGSATARR